MDVVVLKVTKKNIFPVVYTVSIYRYIPTNTACSYKHRLHINYGDWD